MNTRTHPPEDSAALAELSQLHDGIHLLRFNRVRWSISPTSLLADTLASCQPVYTEFLVCLIRWTLPITECNDEP
jgi:hypothetical protein